MTAVQAGRLTGENPVTENQIINQALTILESRLRQPGAIFGKPDESKNFLRLNLAESEHEVFSVLFLDNQHGLIEYVELFRGTIDGASVYAREVVKEALSRNAAAVIFAHNHPSGVSEPSQADRQITDRLKAALLLVDVRTLDHIVIGRTDCYSFAEHGLI